MLDSKLPSMLLVACLFLPSCAGARLSHDEVRRKVAEIGSSSLVPQAIDIRRIVSQSSNQAIAETSVALAFQFKRDAASSPWRIEAVRLGDRDWISMDELLAAIQDARRRQTEKSLQLLAAGVAEYRKKNGSPPNAADIVALTDILHPTYMSDLIRTDAWGRALHYEAAGGGFRLASWGADGQRGTADDILLVQ